MAVKPDSMIAMMGETGYFLAKKFDAALGLYFTGMVSFVTVDNAMGQPHNTAYLPMPMLVSNFSFRIQATWGKYRGGGEQGDVSFGLFGKNKTHGSR